MDNAPIGIFDSGLGGLTVARAVIDKLPDEHIIYLGDTANTPYGPKPIATVREHTLAGLDELASRGVKALVIACNTATAAAVSDARERYWIDAGIPVIEVITPAARAAVNATRNRRIGVIGTEATIRSEAYSSALAAVPGLELHARACPRFVEFVEAGITHGPDLESVAREYLVPLKSAGVDTLVLGCTHYPLLTGVIGRVMGEGVTLVTSSEATANVTYNELVDRDMLHVPLGPGERQEHLFLTTEAEGAFPQLARRFLGPEVQQVHHVDVDSHGGGRRGRTATGWN
ncbi:glutamate racemase [Schaalia sp. 19OD2882]|uniref:glutamate racemase n=1 Tax=Schaalia sp. 19OD2882 TaxID=2794089 RepID=UPI001C1F0307|nr:glutamate racemase [Schaalia sp. 19OD2882]QWW20180.1 glutamate racemase [Schaalia sp. 19OD2882]